MLSIVIYQIYCAHLFLCSTIPHFIHVDFPILMKISVRIENNGIWNTSQHTNMLYMISIMQTNNFRNFYQIVICSKKNIPSGMYALQFVILICGLHCAKEFEIVKSRSNYFAKHLHG